MKAVVRTKYGSPAILSVEEVEIPTPKGNEVLIRVHATTVNRTDCASNSRFGNGKGNRGNFAP